MSITHTLSISNLRYYISLNGLQKVVKVIDWTLRTVDDSGNEIISNGFDVINTDEVNQSTFIPFESLTESDVMSWINVDRINVVKQDAERRLYEKLNPTIGSEPLPWSN